MTNQIGIARPSAGREDRIHRAVRVAEKATPCYHVADAAESGSRYAPPAGTAAVPDAVECIEQKPDHQPHAEAQPGVERQPKHQEYRGKRTQRSNDIDRRSSKRPCSSGSLMRSTSTPTQTMAKANKVPMLTSSPTSPIGRRPASTVTTTPVMMVVT